ncbi:MAG TPA: type II toxin-antitoxin system HicB family antitoxin [Bryobacteraceae bacterium]|nr:type II toxin-antitoxin system HicB family antitoxin [Bryobacteraceae bacterium]
MNEYLALFEPAEEGGFVVTFPDFDWGVTQGDSEEEAVEMAVDALEMIVADHIGKGQPLPRASKPRGRKYRIVGLPTLSAMKAELYRAFRESGIRKADLARRLGIPTANVDRLFDLKHHSRIDQIEAAFKAVGKELTIGIRDAA